jgi:hypothetical protein
MRPKRRKGYTNISKLYFQKFAASLDSVAQAKQAKQANLTLTRSHAAKEQL